jgi:hypothetical protein
LWWNPKAPDEAPLWKSTLTLGADFYEEVIKNPVPVDMRALKALKRSPLALDIYCWLTYRMSYLRKPTEIPWAALQMQFGADYTRTRGFKESFLHHLRAVLTVYPEANVEDGERGLLLKPSKPHVAQLPPALPRLKNPPAWNRCCSRCLFSRGTPGRICGPPPMNGRNSRSGVGCVRTGKAMARVDRSKRSKGFFSAAAKTRMLKNINNKIKAFNRFLSLKIWLLLVF